jgi:hypothetical protein
MNDANILVIYIFLKNKFGIVTALITLIRLCITQ